MSQPGHYNETYDEYVLNLIWACKQGVDIDWDTLKEWAKNPDDERNVILSLLETVL